ncbi:unnamed protein product [Diamesa tonsa]
MQLIGVLLICLCVEAQCTSINDIKRIDQNYGVTWMFFPDADGNPQIIDLTEPDPNMRFAFIDEDPDAKISLYFYDSNRKTKIIIHGWKNNLNSDAIQLIKNAYLKDGDYNVIGKIYLQSTSVFLNVYFDVSKAVDWNEMANENNYLKSAGSTKFVGKNVAAVIDHLVIKKNANIDDIHIIGHSLVVLGYSGMYTTAGKVGRITGLDPAYPAFRDTEKINQNLDKSDAQFVGEFMSQSLSSQITILPLPDVIHTCGGLLGHNQNLGNADFFPNGGQANQPGCDFTQDFIGACSHGRAYRYFAESIETKTGFISFECDSWDSYLSKDCNSDPIQMGESTPRTANGTYYLETTSGPTYSRFFKIN